MANDIVDNDAHVCLLVDGNTAGCSECLPLTINVVDEIDKSGRSICRSKWHNCISPFDGIGALKGKLLLTGFRYR